MTYTIKMIVLDPERTLTVSFAGCSDEDHAKQKAGSLYRIKKIQSIVRKPDKKEKVNAKKA